MKIQILQLESHDDITSARDKMTWANASRILLAWPHTRRLFNRKIDLVLLQRHAKSLGAQLGLVTRQRDVRNHADELGIPVFRSIQQARRKAWGIPALAEHPAARRVYRGDLRQAKPTDGSSPRFLQFKAIRLITFGIGILAIFSLFAFLLPSANVEISVPSQTQELDLDISARPAGSLSVLGSIPYSTQKVTIAREGQAPTTGWVEIPDKAASGNVELSNLTGEALSIPKGSILLSGGISRYQLMESIELPAILGSTSRAPVQAVVGGSLGNAAAGAVNALEGALGFQVAVTNSEAITGGTDLREQAPSETDIHDLESKIIEEMEDTAEEQILASLGEGMKLITGSTMLERVMTRRISPTASSPAAQVNISIEAEFSAAVYSEQDLKTAAATLLDAGLPSGMVSVPGSLDVNLLDDPISNNAHPVSYTLKIKAARKVSETFDGSLITMAAAGRNVENALTSLRNAVPQADNVTIRTKPSWWPFVPPIPFRIRVEQPNLSILPGGTG